MSNAQKAAGEKIILTKSFFKFTSVYKQVTTALYQGEYEPVKIMKPFINGR